MLPPPNTAVAAAPDIDLDEQCRAALMELPSHVQQQILSEVTPSTRNPSAFVWSKIKSLLPPPSGGAPASGVGMVTGMEGLLPMVTGMEGLLPMVTGMDIAAAAGIDLDEQCRAGLMSLPAQVQQQILAE